MLVTSTAANVAAASGKGKKPSAASRHRETLQHAVLLTKCAQKIQEEWRKSPRSHSSELDSAPWRRLVNAEARKLHTARESCQARMEDLAIACRDPSMIFAECRADVLAAVRVVSAANRGLEVMKVGSERRSSLRHSAKLRIPLIMVKLSAVNVFSHLLEDIQQNQMAHVATETSWEQLADKLATTSDMVKRACSDQVQVSRRSKMGAFLEAESEGLTSR